MTDDEAAHQASSLACLNLMQAMISMLVDKGSLSKAEAGQIYDNALAGLETCAGDPVADQARKLVEKLARMTAAHGPHS